MKSIVTLSAAIALLILASAGVVAQTMQHRHGQTATPPAGGHMMQHGQGAAKPGDAQLSEASKAYLEAMDRMHGPMMEGSRDPDADVAFVKGMIPHHQGAIDMARIVLRHGKDEAIRKLANDVIREQEREIALMREWLKHRGH